MSLRSALVRTGIDLGLALLIAAALLVTHAATVGPNIEWSLYRDLQAVGLGPERVGLGWRMQQVERWGYRQILTCQEMPADDSALENWLRQQPVGQPTASRD